MAIYISYIHINRLDRVTILVDEVYLTQKANGKWINEDKLTASQLRAFRNYVDAFEPYIKIKKIESQIAQVRKQYSALADMDINAPDYGQLAKFYQKRLRELNDELEIAKKQLKK